MAFKSFIRETEYKHFENFIKKLKDKRRIKFVSNLKSLRLVPENYTGVYISEANGSIVVFVEKGKKASIRQIAA